MKLSSENINISYVSFLILCLFNFISLTTSALPNNVKFEHISLKEGLSQQYVFAIYQDTDGYMWFGTQEGLNRFDGYQFEAFLHNPTNKNTIASDWIYSINQSEDGKIWIGTKEGISRYDSQLHQFDHFTTNDKSDSLSSNFVRVIHIDKEGTVWVGTQQGLNKFIPETNSFKRFSTSMLVKDLKFEILAIEEDITGALWLGTSQNGLYRFDPKTEDVTFHAKSLSKTDEQNSSVRSLLIDSNHSLWIGTRNDGGYVLDLKADFISDKKDTFTRVLELEDTSITAMIEDENAQVWFATNEGLFVKDSDNNYSVLKKNINDPMSLSSNRVFSLFKDKSDVFWVGASEGLNKWVTSTSRFKHYRASSELNKSLSSNSVLSIQPTHNDKVWVGTVEGLNLVNEKTKTITQFLENSNKDDNKTIRSNAIASLYSDVSEPQSSLWIGYMKNGASLFNQETNTFTHYQHDENDPSSISRGGVTAIKKGPDNNLWFSTFGGGLNKYDPSTDQFITYMHNVGDPKSISSNRVMTVFTDAKGYMWLGHFEEGIDIFNPETGDAFNIKHDKSDPNSLGSDLIWAIHEDKHNNIWIGTNSSGLNLLTAENRAANKFVFEHFTRFEGLPSNWVYGILEDENGMLWLSTNRGLSKFDPATKTVLNYDSSHGLQGDEFNSGAFASGQNNVFYFGGNGGMTAFNPADIKANSYIPPVVLTRFQRLNDVNSLSSQSGVDSNIEITHKDYLIAFEFAGLDYSYPMNNRYKYKLEGFDENWVEARDVRKATYTNLPSGEYMFKVRASNNDGVWNNKGAQIALKVVPAPWFSWWAYTTYILLILAIIYWLYRFYRLKLEQEETYRLALETEVQKRTYELSEANDMLLSVSITDQLTGLHNRRYLASIIEQQCHDVLRSFDNADENKQKGIKPSRLFCLMFDLDGFKPINDTYGHVAGDEVIVQVGKLLKKVCRSSDTVVRWGGDEFLVLGKVDDKKEVTRLAERIRVCIDSWKFDIDGNDDVDLSCSIGFSLYPFADYSPKAVSWEQVQMLADNALYLSKDIGRNAWTGLVQAEDGELSDELLRALPKNTDEAISLEHVNVLKSEINQI